MKPLLMLAGGLCVLLGAGVSRADVWDEGGDADNTCSSTPDNDLLHGASQVHDLGALPGPAVDQDFYTFAIQPFASYEAVVDGVTGDLNNGGSPDYVFERWDGTCAPVQTAAPAGIGFSKSIRFESTSASFGVLRVGPAACGTSCTAADQYHLSFRETTYSIPRFNNSATQQTILILQNPTTYSIHVTPYFFDAQGTLLSSTGFSIDPKGTLVLNTSTVAALQGQSGSIVLANTGRYGDLSGKAVALEAATGFTFDTPMTARVY